MSIQRVKVKEFCLRQEDVTWFGSNSGVPNPVRDIGHVLCGNLISAICGNGPLSGFPAETFSTGCVHQHKSSVSSRNLAPPYRAIPLCGIRTQGQEAKRTHLSLIMNLHLIGVARRWNCYRSTLAISNIPLSLAGFFTEFHTVHRI